MIHLTNPHDPPERSGYTDADFRIGMSVWVGLEPEPATITGRDVTGWLTRAADGVDLAGVSAWLLSPAPGTQYRE